MFCCGTCTASYCCSSPKERLDQESCPEIIKKAEDRKAALFTVTPPQKSKLGSKDPLAKTTKGVLIPEQSLFYPTLIENHLTFAQLQIPNVDILTKDIPKSPDFGSSSKPTGIRNFKPEAGVLLLENEQCNEWIEGHANPVETFHCPTQDEYWKIFCCGTCTASYCCSSPKERLDQESCAEGVKGRKDQETEDPTELSIALSTIFSMLLCSLKCWIEWKEDRRERRMANAQLDLIRGIRTVSVVDTQAAQGASVTPDLLSLGAAESQNPSEQPTAVANAPCGSGNLIREMMMSPAFALRGGAGEEEKEIVL
ncbi:hypothetical protein Chor_004416 [Crotalus horridus]